MKKGDIIRISILRKADFGPEHYGIYDGYGGVYHYNGYTIDNVYVQHSSLGEFEDGGRAYVYSGYEARFSPDEIVRRAGSKLGSHFGGYNLYSNNCEHFATWCSTGVRQSRQTRHVNRDDDKRDIGERFIDAGTIPLINFGDKIDKALSWGDFRKNDEPNIGEEIFNTICVRPLDAINDWLDSW